MKKLKVKLKLHEDTLLQLSKYEDIEKHLSDMINAYYIKGIGRPNKDGVSKQTLLVRAYYNHRRAIELSYTKKQFVDHFLNDKKFNKLFQDYYESNYDKQLTPSFKRASKLKDIVVLPYSEIMKRNNATPITVDYYGDITHYPSANQAAKELDMNILTLKKALKLGYYQDPNMKLYYS